MRTVTECALSCTIGIVVFFQAPLAEVKFFQFVETTVLWYTLERITVIQPMSLLLTHGARFRFGPFLLHSFHSRHM